MLGVSISVYLILGSPNQYVLVGIKIQIAFGLYQVTHSQFVEVLECLLNL